MMTDMITYPSKPLPPEEIAENLEAVRRRIEVAAGRAGRDSAEVELVAVSKTYPPEAVRAAAEAGQLLFGENRVQEGAAKIPLCPSRLRWHLVGHLQSNKAGAAVRLFDCIHSVDSPHLLLDLERHAVQQGRRLSVLVQVNVSGELSKSGIPPSGLPSILELVPTLRAVTVDGLMTIPPASENPEDARPVFRALRELRDSAAEKFCVPLPHLSMGMTHDMDVAVEEGATFVRVGIGIFGARTYT